MTSFAAVVKNEQLWYELPHVLFGAFVTGSFVVAGMAAFALLKKKNVTFFRKSIKVSLIVGLVASIGVIGMGDLQTRYIIKEQPMKFAATEGLYKDSGSPASWAVIEGMDTKNHKANWSIEIPYVLDILSYHKLSGNVKGQNTLNKELHAKYDKKFGKDMNYYVPTKTLFWSFRVMTVAGGLFALIAIIGLYFNRAKSTLIERQRWFLWVLGICTFLPFAANTAGWLITELGRYPWVVYGLLTIADAVSPNVSVASLLISNIVYFCLFSGLGIVMIVLSRRALHQGPDDLLQASDDAPYDPYGKEAFSHE